MKVLKYSTDPKDWKLPVTCQWCKSLIEVSADDISHTGERGDYIDPGWNKYTVDCGACSEEVELAARELPNIIQSYVKNKKRKK